MKKLRSEETDRLFEAILTLKSIDECYAFFEDACTVNEISEIAQRLSVAGMLKNGENYAAISHSTGASTATISRVNKCLTYGADGYNLVLARLDGKEFVPENE